MNLKKKSIVLKTLLFTSMIALASCSSSNEPWKPGENAIEGANQPTNITPVGHLNSLNKMKITQNKHGIPAQGNVNLLVVPLTFIDDGDIELQERVDLTFDDKDIANINDIYFSESNSIHPSVKEYYKISSYSKLNIDGVVTPTLTYHLPFLTLLENITYGTATLESVNNDIIKFVYDTLFVNTETYCLDHFDSDKDGKIDAIQILINYPVNYVFAETNIDATFTKFVNYQNVYFNKDITNNTPVNSFCISSEHYLKNGFGSLYSRAAIYQIGLALGLECYGDKIGNSETGNYRLPMGLKDMMDGCVGDHSSFSKYQLGWISPNAYKANEIPSEGFDVELKDFTSSGESIVLYIENHSRFGEYLILDYYTPTSLNAYDKNGNTINSSTYSIPGVRVTHVDARLLRGYANTVFPYNGEPNFNETFTLPNGEKVNYMYDYRHTNNYYNNYLSLGVTSNNPLCMALSKNGLNRHATSPTYLENDDLFVKGDSFNWNKNVDSFYNDFTFYDGEELNISFIIKDITNDKAVITLKGVE